MWWARYRLVGRMITIWKQSTNLICLMNIWNWSFNTDLLLCLWQLSHWPHFLLWSTMLLRSGKLTFLKYISEVITTLCPEVAENMCLGSQVPDLCFWKQNCIRNPKMGSKQSISDPPSVMFFSKNWFRSKKNHKKMDVLLIFEFLRQ